MSRIRFGARFQSHGYFRLGVLSCLVGLFSALGCTSQEDTGFVNMPTLPAEDGGRFIPSFQDEFDGTDIDTTKWYVWDDHVDLWPEKAPWRRNWKASNAYLENGALVMRVQRDGEGFSSAGLRTGPRFDGGKNLDPVTLDPAKFQQAFGRFEVRMRFHSQQGHWSAFWLMTAGAFNEDGSGRDGTEIDVVEKAWLIDRAGHALHWDGYWDAHQSASHHADGFGLDDGGWHIVALEWYPSRYVFFVDGVETWRTSEGGVSQVPAHLRLTDEVGHYGEGPDAFGVGPIEEAAELPDFTHVDYVRVWAYEPAE